MKVKNFRFSIPATIRLATICKIMGISESDFVRIAVAEKVLQCEKLYLNSEDK